MKKGFTLIELLAVIVILAIIALIATPIILNTINDSKKEAARLSVKNYIRAVEIAISNEQMKSQINTEYLTCEIEDNGRQINCGIGYTIPIEYNGESLISGTIELEKGVVTRVVGGKVNGINTNVKFANGEVTFPTEVKKSTLIKGTNFNIVIKKLVNSDNQSINYSTIDTKITSIEFYSNGIIPNGYTKESINKLKENNQFVDVSTDGSIIAYYDNGKIFVCSDNLISFNELSNSMFSYFSNLSSINFGNIDTSQVTNMSSMFALNSALKSLDLTSFDTSKVEKMNGMFNDCPLLESINLSSFDTLNVTDMYQMFRLCSALENITFGEEFVVGSNAKQMFMNCSSLTTLDLTSFNTSKVTNMSGMFLNCSGLTNIIFGDKFNTSGVTDMDGMFNSCSKLTSLDLSNFNTSGVTNMYQMFRLCSALENITFGEEFVVGSNAKQMFMNCSSLTTLDLTSFNTSKVTNMSGMFLNCSGLTNIIFGEKFNTSGVTDMSSMFSSCSKLTSLDLSNFNTSGVTNMNSMFSYTNTFEVTIGENWTVKNATTTDMFKASSITNQEELLSK